LSALFSQVRQLLLQGAQVEPFKNVFPTQTHFLFFSSKPVPHLDQLDADSHFSQPAEQLWQVDPLLNVFSGHVSIQAPLLSANGLLHE
jgi:hypothetical protein